ncbi:MAG: hypothetical protein ACQGVC_09230 [Myxococcota bacterium]
MQNEPPFERIVSELVVEIDTIPVDVRISAWGPGRENRRWYHFVFTTQGACRGPNPMSETGYFSHLLAAEAKMRPAELEACARSFALQFGGGSAQSGQLDLFG